MALIQMTDHEGEIFRAWLRYFGESNPANRTHAFFSARRGEWPPYI